MKKSFLAIALISIAATSQAQVYLNEILANPPGSDSSTSRGLEFFELRGTPNMSLSGYYVLSLEGQGTTGKGDVNQMFDLGAFSIGGNGYLSAVQYLSPYAVSPGASVISNSFSFGWGQANTAVGSSVGHSSDGTQVDFENSAATILLVNIGAGAAPTTATDLDADNDGTLELPGGWTLLDSVGLSDGTGTQAADEVSYGAITFRIGLSGSENAGNLVQVGGTAPSLYVFRKGESTGSTINDWVGASLAGTAPGFTLTNATDSAFEGLTLGSLGDVNPVPEPATWALLGLGISALGYSKIRRKNRSK